VSKQKLPFGKVTLYEFDKNGEWQEKEQKESSTYDFKVETDKRYKLVGAAEGFTPTETLIDIKETRAKNFLTTDAQLDKNIFLKTDSTGIYSDYYTATAYDVLMKYKINNIYYDYDKYYIRPDAATELDKLLDLLIKHPEATISITSHTDTKASVEYNQKLSELRAGAAVKYLVDRGIEPERITFVGMGKTKPIYSPEKNDYEMQVNRRTEFRITSVNFVSKNKGKELQSVKELNKAKDAQKVKDAETLKELNKTKELKAGIKK
jgi:outer membrane protein OmpA-like peptidoglycan-associated protein